MCRRRIRARLVSVNDKLPKMALGIHPGNYHYLAEVGPVAWVA